MTEAPSEDIRKIVIIDASPEIVFRELTNEAELTKWFSNQMTVLEPQVGGSWMLKNCQFDTGGIYTMRGKILEIIQDKKLSYTWNVDKYPDMAETIVTWMLEPLDGGVRTELKLVHSGWTQKLTDMMSNWNYFIGKLVEYCKEKKQQGITSSSSSSPPSSNKDD